MKNENNNLLNYRVFLKYLIRCTSVYQIFKNYINYIILQTMHTLYYKKYLC